MASTRNSRRAPARLSNTTSTRPNVREIAVRSYGLQRQSISPFRELGTSGLRQWSGWVLDEWLNELQGREKAWRFREFMDNDPVAGGFLNLLELLARRVTWSTTGGPERWRSFVEECRGDMSHSWEDFVIQALSMAGYGYKYHEEVFKYRRGLQRQAPAVDVPADEEASNFERASSKYNDGLVGWRKLAHRAPETTLHWEFGGYSTLRGMVQLDWHGGNHFIPITKALLFRPRIVNDNPEGYSLLRRAWTSWYRMRNLQDIEAIGAGRDLAGIPYAKPPPGIDLHAPQHETLFQTVKELITTIHRDEDEGIVYPSADWEFGLLSSPGSRQFDTDKIIRRYEQRIAASILIDWLLLGQDGLGSYAMVDVKSEFTQMAFDAILDAICEVINRYGIPRLLALNGYYGPEFPRITHTSAGRIDLEKVANFLHLVATAGAPINWQSQGVAQMFAQAGLGDGAEDMQPIRKTRPAPRQRSSGGADAVPLAKAQEREAEETEAQRAEREAAETAERLGVGAAAPATLATPLGTALLVGPLLSARAVLLAVQLEREILSVLGLMGSALATAYLTFTAKNPGGWLERKQLANRLLSAFNLRNWLDTRLEPLFNNQASRVTSDTIRTLDNTAGLHGAVDEKTYRQINRDAMRFLHKSDLEPQIRRALNRILEEAFQAGEDPETTARKIKQLVPAGRFVNAGSQYRARLIARDVTAEMQRQTARAVYESIDDVVAVRLRDGIYGPPRSDSECIKRDGEIVPLADSGNVHPYHVLCTLGFEPVVRS